MSELFTAPAEGILRDIVECTDPVFAEKMMGDGILVEPTAGKINAPCDAVIKTVTKTMHAITFTSDKGIDFIIHVGIDTVEMNGDGFVSKVKDGEHVIKGQTLLEVDLTKIKERGYDCSIILVILNKEVSLQKYFLNEKIKSDVEVLKVIG